MQSRLLLNLYRLHQRLWVKPLVYCLLAISATFAAKGADFVAVLDRLPEIAPDTIEKLLSIISTTMLAVATFAVGSMVSAYSSASETATPRAFELILADDLSQTALSSFIGAFIFSIVGIIALKTGIYGHGGHLALFALTILIIAWVILTFVRWVDNIARLGRMPSTIDRAEAAARTALAERRKRPHLGGRKVEEAPRGGGLTIFADKIGYVQLVEVDTLQKAAEEAEVQVVVEALPGTFVTPDQPLARVVGGSAKEDSLRKEAVKAFVIGNERTFEADPRFGLIVLSEIAQRALSPGVNDPGTAIVIVGRLVRLFAFWLSPREADEAAEEASDRVFVPGLRLTDLFDDAFSGIARDGAGSVETGIRLQKAFAALAAMGDRSARAEAERHSRLALAYSEATVPVEEDLERLRRVAQAVPREAG